MKDGMKVTMFGSFEVRLGDSVLNGSVMRSSQLEKLLVYLIIYRDRKITLQEFVDVLWEDGIDNPSGALKNLVYRLRNVLKKVSDEQFIKTSQGSYMWSSDIPIALDAELFEESCKKARTFDGELSEKIALYEVAVNMYKGRFLADFAFETWLVALSTYYHSLYLTMVKELAPLYEKNRSFDKVQSMIKFALGQDGLDEELHYWNIKSLARQNKVQLALAHYDEASKILYKNLGIRNSEKLRQVYVELMDMKNGQQATVDEICEAIREEQPLVGAYYCNYSVFQEIYRLESRRISRLGVSEYVLLLTLHSSNPVKEDVLEKVMTSLQNVICNSLRIGDVVAKCSSVQHIVLLQTCSYETGCMVAERIIANFEQLGIGRNFKMIYDIKEVELLTSGKGDN